MEIHEEIVTRRYIEFDGIRFHPDRKGYWLGQRKDTKKPVRLHVYVWEHYNGPVPKGYHVHHKDFNPDNNEIDNLELVEKGAHLRYHAQFQDAEWARNNLAVNARPKASEWHRSEKGRAWHRKHALEITAPLFKETVTKTCHVCGREYQVPKLKSEWSRFCSNNCKSQYRRNAGIDNIEVACEICGKKYWTNKYSKRKYCSEECRSVARRGTREGTVYGVPCGNCGKILNTTKHARVKYCSPECANLARRNAQVGKSKARRQP